MSLTGLARRLFYSQGNVAGDDMGDVGLSTATGLPLYITAPGLRVIGEWKERTSTMNRFFSKLNLQDIKINPEGHRFPPDEDDQELSTETHQQETPVSEAVAVQESVSDPYAPTRDTAPAFVETAPVVEPEVEPVVVSTASAHLNGHLIEETSEIVEYIAETGVVAVAGEVLKVSARSRPSAVAGAIAGVVREAGRAEVQAIGAGATNQAVKAVAIARDYLSETGIDAICVPAFIDVTIENEDRTAIRLVVEPR